MSSAAAPSAEITGLLHAWRAGEAGALGRLLPEVLAELRRLARHYLSLERPGNTYQPSDLVNEAYLRLVGREAQAFEHRSEFFAFAARLMREILVDHARAKRRAKRGGSAVRLPLDEALDLSPDEGPDSATILAVNEAVTRLGELNPRHRRVVELRFFVGLTVPEIAQALGLGRATVERDWAVARRWLARELSRSRGTPSLEGGGGRVERMAASK